MGLLDTLSRTQWWWILVILLFCICGLGWLSKSSLYALTLPSTSRQSDSQTAAVQRKKAWNVQLSDKWAFRLLHIETFSLFSFLLPQSASLLQTFSLGFLQPSPLCSHSPSCPTSFSLYSIAPAVLFCPHVSGLFFFFNTTSCHLSVRLHLTLLSHYRCDLSSFTASTLTDTDGDCDAPLCCAVIKKETCLLLLLLGKFSFWFIRELGTLVSGVVPPASYTIRGWLNMKRRHCTLHWGLHYAVVSRERLSLNPI